MNYQYNGYTTAAWVAIAKSDIALTDVHYKLYKLGSSNQRAS